MGQLRLQVYTDTVYRHPFYTRSHLSIGQVSFTSRGGMEVAPNSIDIVFSIYSEFGYEKRPV